MVFPRLLHLALMASPPSVRSVHNEGEAEAEQTSEAMVLACWIFGANFRSGGIQSEKEKAYVVCDVMYGF